MPLLSLTRHRVCHPRAVVRASVRHASPVPSPGRASRALPAAAAAAAVLGLGAYYLLRPDPPRGAPTSSVLPLARTHFTPARVLSSEPTSPDTRLLTLQLPPAAAHSPEGAAPVWSVLVKDADIMLERPFTPLRGVGAGGTLQLWVKAYPGGEVGRWLHARAPGDVVELRGPVQTLAWPFGAGDWDEVVLISGGTGFAPFFQLLHHTLLEPSPSVAPMPRVTLLHASRSPQDLPPPALLDPLHAFARAHPDRLRVQLFVDAPAPAPADGAPAPPAAVQRIDAAAVQDALGIAAPPRAWWQLWPAAASPPPPPKRGVLFLVCGPEPMVAALAGPYGPNFSQGAVGGVLGALGYGREQVRKL